MILRLIVCDVEGCESEARYDRITGFSDKSWLLFNDPGVMPNDPGACVAICSKHNLRLKKASP